MQHRLGFRRVGEAGVLRKVELKLIRSKNQHKNPQNPKTPKPHSYQKWVGSNVTFSNLINIYKKLDFAQCDGRLAHRE